MGIEKSSDAVGCDGDDSQIAFGRLEIEDGFGIVLSRFDRLVRVGSMPVPWLRQARGADDPMVWDEKGRDRDEEAIGEARIGQASDSFIDLLDGGRR